MAEFKKYSEYGTSLINRIIVNPRRPHTGRSVANIERVRDTLENNAVLSLTRHIARLLENK